MSELLHMTPSCRLHCVTLSVLIWPVVVQPVITNMSIICLSGQTSNKYIHRYFWYKIDLQIEIIFVPKLPPIPELYWSWRNIWQGCCWGGLFQEYPAMCGKRNKSLSLGLLFQIRSHNCEGSLPFLNEISKWIFS